MCVYKYTCISKYIQCMCKYMPCSDGDDDDDEDDDGDDGDDDDDDDDGDIQIPCHRVLYQSDGIRASDHHCSYLPPMAGMIAGKEKFLSFEHASAGYGVERMWVATESNVNHNKVVPSPESSSWLTKIGLMLTIYGRYSYNLMHLLAAFIHARCIHARCIHARWCS